MLGLINSFFKNIVGMFKFFFRAITFVLLLFVYFIGNLINSISNFRLFPKFIKVKLSPVFSFMNSRVIGVLDPHIKGRTTISRVELIDLSVKNMRAKGTRATISMGGMMIGIGSIVFLVSIGYGLQNLVINRVARLDEMQQTDVTTQAGGNVKINDESVARYRELSDVERALPLIAVVGRVNYNNSVSDMAAYGVTTNYLKESAVKPVSGRIFESNEEVLAASSSTSDWVELPSEANTTETTSTKTIELSPNAVKEAVVNRAMLKVLGINESEALGKSFSVSFIILGELQADRNEKVESVATNYRIVGISPEEEIPFFYVPFIDLRGLGITNYSQVKVIVKDQSSLSKVRNQIEAMGFVTMSVADTVAQINSLFSTIRLILAFFGLLALVIASLGMFNTLTVSLLERTREVGLMKAMGMKSSEVRELFLTESMIMGIIGGVLGLTLGWVLGKLLGLFLSTFAIYKGVGAIDVSYIPFSFTLVILCLSFSVGLFTGIYPARRATKISALNALRYE